MDDQTKSFRSAAGKAMTDVAASLEPQTKESNGSQDEHKLYFLKTIRRWEMLFKRKDGNVESDKWLITEYYKSLGHLSEAGLDRLTEVLKETHTFFPTIKECLDATRCGQYDYAHPFISLRLSGPSPLLRIGASTPRQIAYDRD